MDIIYRNSLPFSGEMPDYASLIPPPQTFGIKLIASGVEGFSGSSISFAIEVGVCCVQERIYGHECYGGKQDVFGGISNSLELD